MGHPIVYQLDPIRVVNATLSHSQLRLLYPYFRSVI